MKLRMVDSKKTFANHNSNRFLSATQVSFPAQHISAEGYILLIVNNIVYR